MFYLRGIPVREIHGLPYAVHQVGDGLWQIVIENCPRYPSGYTFHSVYHSQEEALQALADWPGSERPSGRGTKAHSANSDQWAGDDTGVMAWLAEPQVDAEHDKTGRPS
ncbi:MAG: hypothetical protein K6T63_02955 [Alicyclobacillus herbarius]|uniref:hypothetical protein n=1 Tax=Alicyclobacillus herbarius TaxID=122960 RepID=UPI000400601C|nr:hypothetical protein [Alicyclobacillus herbarius]MCL6631566.1 hypothetical protein [Alicyclobacillus herbarius]